ncbi:MAG: UbiA family prenyltransferase [Planctomycetota bacterium]|jgi:4-hydroxybenzoate polyprenyltransferase|nr:UbiA family prenyltransferase [Planctomycetota bacterium]
MNYLRLIRLPNIFTSIADVWAGYFFLLPLEGDVRWGGLLMLLFVSACLYAGGIALNDVFDLEYDRQHRPERVLPKGTIPVENAIFLILVCFVLALLAAQIVGFRSMIVCGLCLLCIVVYTKISKKAALPAAAAMGLCRFFNLYLGTTLIEGHWQDGLAPAAFLGVYILFVTLLSRMEDSEVKRGRMLFLLVLIISVPTFSALLYKDAYFVEGLAALLWLVFVLFARAWDAYEKATPPAVGQMIRFSILCIICFDAGLVLGAGHRPYGLVCLGFLIPPYFLSKKFAMT